MKTKKNKGFFLLETSITIIIISFWLFALTTAVSTNLKTIKKIRQYRALKYVENELLLNISLGFKTDKKTDERNGNIYIENNAYKWQALFESIDEEKTIFKITINIYDETKKLHTIEKIISIN